MFHFCIDRGQVLQNSKEQKGLSRGLYQVCQVLNDAGALNVIFVMKVLVFGGRA